MRTIYSILLGLFFSISAFSQTNYQTGFLFYSATDSISATIDDEIWDKNPEFIKIKDADSAIKKIHPADIWGFKINDFFYKSAKVIIDKTPKKTNEIELDREEKNYFKEETLFLKVLSEGSVELLKYKSSQMKTHYFVKKGDKIQELQLIRTVSLSNGKRFLKEEYRFKGQLISLLNDCSKIGTEISNAALNDKNLLNIFQKYYACKEEKARLFKIKEKNKYHAGVIAGVNKSYIKNAFIAPSIFTPHSRPISYDLPLSIYFGGFIEVIMPRKSGANSVLIELGYHHLKAISKNSADLDYKLMNTSVLYRYNFNPKKDLRPFLGLGISAGYDNEASGVLLSLAFSAGVNYKKFFIEIRNDRAIPDGQIKTLRFLGGYRIR